MAIRELWFALNGATPARLERMVAVRTIAELTERLKAGHPMDRVFEALVSLDDAGVANAIVDALRKTCGDDVVPEVACGALVRLRAKASIPLLKELLGQREFADHADELKQQSMR